MGEGLELFNVTPLMTLPESCLAEVARTATKVANAATVATAARHMGQLYVGIPGESGPQKMVVGMIAVSMFFAVLVGVWSCFGLPTETWSWIGDIIGVSKINGRLEAAQANAPGGYNYWKTHFRIAAITNLRFIGKGMIPSVMNFPHVEFFDRYEKGQMVEGGSWLPTDGWKLGLWAWHMFCTAGSFAFIHMVCSGKGMMGHTTEWWIYHVAYYWLSEFAIVLPICFIHYHIEENDWFRYYKVLATEPDEDLRKEIWSEYFGKMYNIGYRVSHLAFLIYGGLRTEASLEPMFFTKAWVIEVLRWLFMFYYRWFSTHWHHQSMHTQKDEDLPTDGRQKGRLQYYFQWLRRGGASLFGENKYFGWKHTVHHKWNPDLMALANEDASMEDNLSAVIILNFIPPVLTCWLWGPLSIDQFILVNAWNNYIAFDCHTNYDLPFKPMRLIPGISDFTRFHSFHHSSKGGDDSHSDENAHEGGSAFSISIIDKIFGTYSKYEYWETMRLKAEENDNCSYSGGPVDLDYEVPDEDQLLLEQLSGYQGPYRG